MSTAGIRSNRGDVYQTLIAFDWALTVLSDSEFEWLEIDSTIYLVDDVVICKSDGTLICCQCKKNQPDFRAWSINDLADELGKAFQAMERNQRIKVNFYSRSEFGALAKLHEYSTMFKDEAGYNNNLTQEHKETDIALVACMAKHGLSFSAYEFLCRTSFEITPDFARMETLLRERLRYMASNSDAAFDGLWINLDKLGGRIKSNNLSVSTQHRLTKNDLKIILNNAGAMLVPIISSAQTRTSFSSTSAIGRSWLRNIAGHQFSSPIVDELLAAIDAGKRSILLMGMPGSGKTCVMLNLLELLEHRMQTCQDIVPLFIQSREFADLTTAQERHTQGLAEDWVEQAARLAEDDHLVVLIDSLDVLSIAREHSVLTYFLAQIDRLLLIPNVTVITACRDFDRKYDRRIAVRQWECEFQCLRLNWDNEIVPFLEQLSIDSTIIDNVTRELIRNPRELALFVDLAKHEGSFNVITSQALAQRYLDIIVNNDPLLGGAAMQAIECIANIMLQQRTLSIAPQRFSASEVILRRLQSLNVLQNTHDRKLTFGHQSLLDVLVISSAIRCGNSLNDFIQSLPPVPFVRPSIRNFVVQLAAGDRREFRKQLRTVLTGTAAFHIRRLIAEAFAQQIPQDDDWSLIRELRERHREVFEVIYYSQASTVEWHYFWLSHLVPALKELHDFEGVLAHVHRILQWKNEDPAGVVAFWLDTLTLDWLNSTIIAERIVLNLGEFAIEFLPLLAPLLEQLISIPQPEYSYLGSVLARCNAAGIVDEEMLWRFVVGEINEEDVTSSNLAGKLYSNSFGAEYFLKDRMVKSIALLDLALQTIERWSKIQTARFGETRIGFRHGFLSDTSWADQHYQLDYRFVDEKRILLDAIEAAILVHAHRHTKWWEENRQHLCFSHEGALCYFALRAFTNYPQANINLIGRLLCYKNLLEFELSFELSALIRAAFIHLDSQTQDQVIEQIQALWNEIEPSDAQSLWILKQRAEYVSAIPCHLRSAEAQAMLDACEDVNGVLIHLPSIRVQGGIVTAPFSYEVFLNCSDGGVIRLLGHYSIYNRGFDDFLVGGEQEVGQQLSEASSRQPSRFLRLLSENWISISAMFRDELMMGIANFLKYRHGNSQSSSEWMPMEEPDASILAQEIIAELERHPSHWQRNRSAASALKACAPVIQTASDAERLVFLAIGYSGLNDEILNQEHAGDLIYTGINMISGNVAEALMILAHSFQDRGAALPELLLPTLRRFASSEHPAIRALILRHLPALQSQNLILGWDLFHHTMRDAVGLWEYAEKCLYYAYQNHFDIVAPLLARICREGSKGELETWGRISALSALTGHINFTSFLNELHSLNAAKAWQGASSVFTHPMNINKHRSQCLEGITIGLSTENSHAMAVARQVGRIFQDEKLAISIPIELIRLYFSLLVSDEENKHRQLPGFTEWLIATCLRDPELALAATEIYITYLSHANSYFYDHDNLLVQLMTRLFAEAEEREEADQGSMLIRVVRVQDRLLSLGVSSMKDWFDAAERQ